MPELEKLPRKRQIIITIDDWCSEPFNQTDKSFFDAQFSRALMDYDIEITKVEIKEQE